MDSTTPAQKMKISIANLLGVMQFGINAEFDDVHSQYLESFRVFNSREFRNYRESFGKLAIKASREYSRPEFFDAFQEAISYWGNITDTIYFKGKIKYEDVFSLFSRLQMIADVYQDDIDRLFLENPR